MLLSEHRLSCDPADGFELWDRIKAWSASLVKNNIDYRFVRSAELSDPDALCKENTPIIIDGLGCISDSQFLAIKTCLSKGDKVWLSLSFGTHDERGYIRSVPLSVELLNSRYKNVVLKGTENPSDFLKKLIQQNKFHPVLKQLLGDIRWAARVRFYKDKSVIHFLNTDLVAVPHPTLKDVTGVPILKAIESKFEDNNLLYEISTTKITFSNPFILSPELGDEKRNMRIRDTGKEYSIININLDRVKIYAVVQ
jgi:hypothetical protein